MKEEKKYTSRQMTKDELRDELVNGIIAKAEKGRREYKLALLRWITEGLRGHA